MRVWKVAFFEDMSILGKNKRRRKKGGTGTILILIALLAKGKITTKGARSREAKVFLPLLNLVGSVFFASSSSNAASFAFLRVQKKANKTVSECQLSLYRTNWFLNDKRKLNFKTRVAELADKERELLTLL